jgi:hypothetical protein
MMLRLRAVSVKRAARKSRNPRPPRARGVSFRDAAHRGAEGLFVALISDFFLASREEVARLDMRAGPGELPHVAARHIDPVKLETLESLLTREPGHALAPIRNGGEDGPWVFPIGGGIAPALAKLDDARRSDVAARWAATPESRMDGATPEALGAFLKELTALAQRGAQEGRSIYLWLSV